MPILGLSFIYKKIGNRQHIGGHKTLVLNPNHTYAQQGLHAITNNCKGELVGTVTTQTNFKDTESSKYRNYG